MRTRMFGALCAVAALAVAQPATAAPAPACQELAFSPAFTHDRTMWCSVSVADDGAFVHRSTDGGRSWGRGVRVTSGDARQFLARVVVSPLYARDRRILVWTVEGLYESLDGGATFSSAPVTDTSGRVTPYVDTVGTGVPRAAFVHGIGGNGTYDTALGNRNVVGVPGWHAIRYLVPGEYAATREAVALAIPAASYYREDQAVTAAGASAFHCTADFVCARQGFHFGDVVPDEEGALGRAGQHYLIARVKDRVNGLPRLGAGRVWRTGDSGRTWSAWTSVERLLNAQPVGSWHATITASPDSRHVYLSVVTVVRKGKDVRYGTDDTLAMNVWRSDDDGSTWRRLPVPWTGKPGLHDVELTAQTGNRLYATGSRRGFVGMFCSLDAGRTWRTGTCR